MGILPCNGLLHKLDMDRSPPPTPNPHSQLTRQLPITNFARLLNYLYLQECVFVQVCIPDVGGKVDAITYDPQLSDG